MTTRKSSIVLWIAQVLLALLFAFTGTVKLIMPAAQLAKASPYSVTFMRFIAVCELLGAVGLILPSLTRIKPLLTPIAACCLIIIMIGATATTMKAMGALPALLPFITGVIAAYVAYGRWRIAPLESRSELHPTA